MIDTITNFLNALPLIPTMVFFGIMVVLQIIDSWTTYTALKLGGAKEGNGLMRRLMKAIGIKEALWVAKVGYLTYLWFYPVTSGFYQWLILLLYTGIAINNLRIVDKIKENK